jgi:hypothetical protein
MDIATLDRNYSTPQKVSDKDCVFYDIKLVEQFDIYGLYNAKTNDKYMRMPQEIADKCNHCVQYFNQDTSGGRIRFCTNSKYVALRVKMPFLTYPHQTLAASAGFDLYIDGKYHSDYYKSFIPPVRFDGVYETIIRFSSRKKRFITIYFPLYSHLEKVEIGLQKSAYIERGKKYKIQKPIVFYGSSVMQGGCASKPGNTISGFISRMLDADVVNLGFSSGALGEREMADYIKNLDMSAFICEYDHNAPSVKHLQETHYNFIKNIASKNKDIPIIFASKYDYFSCAYYVKTQKENVARRNVIKSTYDKLIKEGYKNVYFVDGKTIFSGETKFNCTVDGIHLNDLGFYIVAKKFKDVLKKTL